jgi:hypothetical protein
MSIAQDTLTLVIITHKICRIYFSIAVNFQKEVNGVDGSTASNSEGRTLFNISRQGKRQYFQGVLSSMAM